MNKKQRKEIGKQIRFEIAEAEKDSTMVYVPRCECGNIKSGEKCFECWLKILEEGKE